jgi:hypothetical protein
MGELQVLMALVHLDTGSLANWLSPSDGLHDFERAGHALEVKATLGSATQLAISNLAQLDTEGIRRLDLVHVRLAESPNGLNLEDFVEDVLRALPSDMVRREFNNALLRRGLMPDDTVVRTVPRVEVQSTSVFTVGSSFPRLLRSDVPSGVVDAQYTVALRALEPFTCDKEVALNDFIGGAS